MGQLTKILLNEKLEAKLLDTVLSKRKAKETNRSKSMANDVFGFGVVLLQILSGRKAKSLVDEVSAFTLLTHSLISNLEVFFFLASKKLTKYSNFFTLKCKKITSKNKDPLKHIAWLLNFELKCLLVELLVPNST